MDESANIFVCGGRVELFADPWWKLRGDLGSTCGYPYLPRSLSPSCTTPQQQTI